MTTNFIELPADLPVPQDDGAAGHLDGTRLPDVTLQTTAGDAVRLSGLTGWTVIYVYPMTGKPGVPLPDGWDAIPGARGCTPQSCSFRDHHADLRRLRANVFGVSVQSSDYQREIRERLHLPFHVLSDSGLNLKRTLRLPTFSVAGMELYKRLTLITFDAQIRKVFYPVFPPDRNASDVVSWLEKQA